MSITKIISVFTLVIAVLSPFGAAAETDIQRCVRFRDAGNYKDAVLAGERAAGEEKGNMSAWFCLGDSWARMGGRLPQAVSALSNALVTAQRDYDKMKIYYRLGEVLEGVPGEEKALLEVWTHCTRLAVATEDRKTLLTAKNQKARYLEETGNRNAAAREYGELAEMLKSDRRRAIVLNNKAALHLKEKQFGDAITALKAAVEDDSRNGDTVGMVWHRAGLGYAYLQQGETGQAASLLIKAHNEAAKAGIKDDMLWYSIHTYMSEMYIKAGRFNDGKEHAALAEQYYTRAHPQNVATVKKAASNTVTDIRKETKGGDYGKDGKSAHKKKKGKSAKKKSN